MTAARLKAVTFRDTPERMMSLGDLCALVAGRVPLVIEVKSHFDGDRKLVARMSAVLASYRGPVVGMSFDPDQVLALRELMPELPRGIIAERSYDEADWPQATPASGRACCICGTRSIPGRISSPSGSTSCRRRRPGSPQHFRPAAADLDRAHTRAARAAAGMRIR